MSAGLSGRSGAIGVSSRAQRCGNSRLVEVVIVVMVFMVVVVLVPLHHLCQPPLIEQHTGQVPHLLLLHHLPRSCQGAQRPVALALLGPLLVLAIGGC